MPPTACQTVALRAGDLCWRQFDNEDCVAVYDEASGDTHLLPILAYEICRRLSISPRAVESLVEELLLAFPDEDRLQLREALDAALEQLEAIDLVVCQWA